MVLYLNRLNLDVSDMGMNGIKLPSVREPFFLTPFCKIIGASKGRPIGPRSPQRTSSCSLKLYYSKVKRFSNLKFHLGIQN
jgi:hypothetical protein